MRIRYAQFVGWSRESKLHLRSEARERDTIFRYTNVELTPLTPKSLLPPADSLPVERFRELTNEETALRHRLELKVERALYRAAVGLQEMGDSQSYDSNRPWLARIWGDEQKVEAAFSEATAALRELNKRQLYRSTHSCFRQYLSERFGWSIEEIYPEGC